MGEIFYPGFAKTKILIIDDEEDICVYLKSALERTRKFKVWATTSPAEGIMLARATHPDLVLLDIIMPEMDGTEVAERLSQDPVTKDILVAFVTVLANKEDVAKNKGVIGGHPFIAKPIEKDELVQRIESLLHEYSAVQKNS